MSVVETRRGASLHGGEIAAGRAFLFFKIEERRLD